MNICKETEYTSLRQEILDSITARDNYIMAMYTITVAILCVAFQLQNPIIFLLPYIILFSFQNTIAAKNENMIVLAAYISVYLEEGHGWESNSIDLKKSMHKTMPFKRPRSVMGRLMGRIGSVQLGLLCSVCCLVFAVVDVLTAVEFAELIEPAIYIVLSIIMYILIRVQTKDVLKLGDRKEIYIEDLRKAMELADQKQSVLV